ncbi:MAG: hypothetical protein CMP07_10245 [Xanthomonadales bacterium]|nr:hypothetical protein [Xanthomonadales bacterium]|tara:strand:+ start:642 stop:4787 length:4146 start_codon:yes stop_codon:yes gene_type:complete
MHEDATGNPKSFTPPFSAGYLHPKRLIPALVVGLLAVPLAYSQQIVDDWTTVHGALNATPGTPVAMQVVTGSGIVTAATDGDGVGERDVRVEFISGGGGGQTTSSAGSGNLDHGEVDSRGNTFIIWDGEDGTAAAATFDGNNNVSGGGLATTGLRGTGATGLNLEQACPGTQDSFAIIAGDSDNSLNYDIVIDVFTDDDSWSSLSRTEIDNGLTSILTFPFDDFVSQGSDASGADFTDVGAIRMRITPAGQDVDLKVLTPFFTCGIDLGDAAAELSVTIPGVGTLTSFVDSRVAPLIGPAGNDGVIENASHAVVGPRLGASVDAESQTVAPSAAGGGGNAEAIQDDNTGADDHDGVEFPILPALSAGDAFPVEISVQNVLDSDGALLCGWIDFTDTDQLLDFGFQNDDNAVVQSDGFRGERLCVAVNTTNCNGSEPNLTCTLDFVIPGNWNGDNGNPGGTDSGFLARFRVTTDWADESEAVLGGFASDGEVEDYLITSSTLPVSIHSFDSEFTSEGLAIKWGTVSETRNAGFHIWGDRGQGMELLVEDMIPSGSVDPLQPQRYSYFIDGAKVGEIKDLAITAMSYSGDEEIYGLFEAGAKYGESVQPAPIAWDRIDRDVKLRQQLHAAFGKRNAGARVHGAPGRKSSRTSVATSFADVKVGAAGLHRVTWQDLTDAGLDLEGVESTSIAVTLKGEPVSRHIVRRASGVRAPGQRSAMRGAREAGGTPEFFGPGAEILFWGEIPSRKDKLYVDEYVYRVAVNPTDALNAGARMNRGKPGSSTHLARVAVEEDNAYHLASPLEDPWYAARLRADGTNSYSATLSVDNALVSDTPGRLNVVVGGLTSYRVNPDHNIRIELNGTQLANVVFDGSTAKSLSMDVPPGLLVPGNNTVRVLAPGGTAAPYDISLVDRVMLQYPRLLRATDDRVLVEGQDASGGLTIDGFTDLDTLAYAWDGAQLVELNRHQFGRGSIRVPTLEEDGADYWLSSVDKVLAPKSISISDSIDLLSGTSGDFVIIGHPAFLPISSNESHPLNEFIAARESEGWDIAVFDITEIQREFGGGMPLPQAVTAFLSAADSRFGYEHVLLVGADSYDYTDKLGLGSISFIPTLYEATKSIPHTPSDALLADLDGDGVSDKAIGRWPVRSEADLQSIVTKTLDWSGDAEALSNAVWLTDSQDPAQPSFRAQAGRMSQPLLANGWLGSEIAGIYFDEILPVAGMSQADAAREAFFDKLEQGRSLAGFIGHGAPAMWTFQGLLAPDDIADLYNEGNPTLIGTLTCYTTYFVSPFSDTVAHRWMNGYREDAVGNAIGGVPNGAVAIHGAATLSNYGQNEAIARRVLEFQLQGATLGTAVQAARSYAAEQGLRDQSLNWTLLGDPTLRLDP